MIVNIKLDIDWISEDHTIDDVIKTQIINKITDMYHNSIKESVGRKINQRVSLLTDEWINEQLMAFASKRIQITDKWGDTQEYHESIVDMFKTKFDSFFDASVDKEGKEIVGCSYGSKQTRIDYLLTTMAKKYFAKAMKDMEYRVKREVDDEMKKAMEAAIKSHVVRKLTSMAID